MDVARLALRRLLISIPVLFVASILVFTMVANSGDPLADLVLNPRTPPAVIARRRAELNLNKSVVTRYRIWITHFVRGDFGKTNDSVPVRPLLLRRLGVTLRMVLAAMLLAMFLAVLLGVTAAVRQYSVLDYGTTFVGFLLLAMPVFWFAALLKEYAAVRLNHWLGHTWIYTIGDATPNLEGGFWHNIGNYLGHLILPTIALAGVFIAAWSRYQRSSMLDVLNTDYVRLAKAKGLPARRVLFRHALRTALIPMTTVVAIDFGAIFGGAVITETVFDWKGMGDLLITGVRHTDVNIVQAWLMVTAIIVILFNLLADVLYGVLDPRIRQ